MSRNPSEITVSIRISVLSTNELKSNSERAREFRGCDQQRCSDKNPGIA